MGRLLFAIVFVATTVSASPAPPSFYGGAQARNGQVAIGRVSGGSFAPGSFSVGEPGQSEILNGSDDDDGQYWPEDQEENNVPRLQPSRKGQSGVRAHNGQVAIGSVSGGSFGPGAFSVNEPGHRYPINVGSDDDNEPRDWSNHRETTDGPEYAVGNQNDNPQITGYNKGDGSSIAIDEISGGSYPESSVSNGEEKGSIYGAPDDIDLSATPPSDTDEPPSSPSTLHRVKSWFKNTFSF